VKVTTYTLPAALLPITAVPPPAYDPALQIPWLEKKAQHDALLSTMHELDMFMARWRSWFANYDAGRNRDVPPPVPPKGYTAHITLTEHDNGSISFDADPVQDGPPVREAPSYKRLPGDPAIPPPAPEPVPVYELGAAVQAVSPEIDGLPVGFRATSPDGVWVKKANKTPFGWMYFWQKVMG
jgi:hypothetical protein